MYKRVVVAAGVGAGLAALFINQRRQAGEKRLSERLAAAALESLLLAIDANDRETGLHVRRVAAYALVLARAADLDEHEQKGIERVALFHDIGKIHGALVDVIHQDATLSPDERRLIHTHPRRGADVLRPLSRFYPDLCAGVLSHHEWWDGSGYPQRLKGRQIPFQARIVAIADTFDVVTQGRHYRSARTFDKGAEVIARGRGTQFDPDLTDLFLSPPVLAEIHRTVRSVYGPRTRLDGRRRRGPKPAPVPDVTFRWRTGSLAPPAQDQSPQKSLG